MHVHISGLSAAITALEVIVVLWTLGLLAQKYRKTNTIWATIYVLMYGEYTPTN